jgi:hypothetical protein
MESRGERPLLMVIDRPWIFPVSAPARNTAAMDLRRAGL